MMQFGSFVKLWIACRLVWFCKCASVLSPIREKAEIDFPVMAVVKKACFIFQIKAFIVLQDKNSFGSQHLSLKNKLINLPDMWKIIRRVGKNHIPFLSGLFQIMKRIGFNNRQPTVSQLSCSSENKIRATGVCLYSYHRIAATGIKLIRNTACPGKKVEDCKILVINQVVKDIEQTLLGKVGCWS